MVVPFIILLSTAGTNNDIVKLRKKRFIKHVVTLSVVISVLFALTVVAGIILAFELPPKNQKFALEKADLSQDKENWKRQVHVVFAVNLVGPKEARLRRSIENVQRYTLEVIRSLLFIYYGSDAQFVIQTYSIPGKTTITDFCDATCTMRYIDQIDQEPTFTSQNPNQTDAVWQYYRYSLRKKSSLYILFVADRASYRDDTVFEKDMIDSSKMLEETKLVNKTEIVFIDDNNAAHYFMHTNIVNDGKSAAETANLINDRLISYYRNDDKLSTDIAITTVTDSSQFAISYSTEETTLMTIIDDENKNNRVDTKTISSEEFASSTTAFHRNANLLETREQTTTIPSTSSIAKFSETTVDDPTIRNIPLFDSTDSQESPELRNEEEDFIVKMTNAEHDVDSTILSDHHSPSTESTTFTLPLQWTGFSKADDDMDTKNLVESTDTSMQLNYTPTNQILQSTSNIFDEVAGIRSGTKHSTEEYHTLTEESSRLQEYISNTDAPVTLINVSPKYQINDRVEQTKITEISDNSFSDSSSIQTPSPVFETDATFNIRPISDTFLRIDDSKNPDTNLHVTLDATKTMSPSLSPTSLSPTDTVSLLSSESSSSVTHDDIYTSAKDDVKFLVETTDLRPINLHSTTGNTKVTPPPFSKAPTMDETIVTEVLMSKEIDKSTPSTMEFTERRMVTHLETLAQLSTTSMIPPSNIDDFAYSLDDLISASISTDPDDFAYSRKIFNSFFSSKEDGSMKMTKEPNLSHAETNAGEITGIEENKTELKGSTVIESMQNTITSRSDYDMDILDVPDITEIERSTMQEDNEASILKIPQIISELLSNARSSTTISDSKVSDNNKDMGQLISGRSNSFFTTEFSTLLPNISPENETDFSSARTGTSLPSRVKELLLTTSEPLITDNSQQSFTTTSSGLSTSSETPGIIEIIGSSQVTSSLSELSTIPTTKSSDDVIRMIVSFISGRNGELTSDSELTDTVNVNDGIVTANIFTIKPQILPSQETFSSNQATESSMISSLNMEKSFAFIETSTVTPEVTTEAVKENKSTTTVADYETKLSTSTARIPMAIFNITIPPSLIDAKFSSHINRTRNNYNYILVDEVSYTEKNESEILDQLNIALNIDGETILLDDLANETYNDFYSDDSLSSVDDTGVEEKFRLANLALTNKYKMQSQSKMETKSVSDGSKQTDTVTNLNQNTEDRHGNLFSVDSASSSNILTKNTMPLSTLKNTQRSMISQDFDGLKEESDDTTSDNQERNITESTSTTVSQTTDRIKSKVTTRRLDAVHAINLIALNSVENQSNPLPLNHKSTTPTPEIEEIAAINTNHKKIVHQTLTVLKAEKPTINDSFLSILSTIPWPSTLKPAEKNMLIASSSDQVLVDTLQTSIPDITSKSSSMIVGNSFSQQRSIMDKNDMTSVGTVILNNAQDDTSSLIDHVTLSSISSITSLQNSPIEHSLTNRESSQSSPGTSTNNNFSFDKNISGDLAAGENSHHLPGLI